MTDFSPAGVVAAPASRTVPFFRPEIGAEERAEVDRVLRSGWLTSGPATRRFERDFANAVGAPFALAVSSGTAALHLAVEAMGLKHGDAVLVPTMTFAATAEVVRYAGGIPVLVDCKPDTCNIDLTDAGRKLRDLRDGRLPGIDRNAPVKGIIPVDVGGYLCDVAAVAEFAREEGLWIVEDAAHAFPAAWRADVKQEWRRCGDSTADVTCFSFYANKTITTGEGGMAVCADEAVAQRMRLMCLHGLSHDAWDRYTGGGTWDYRIIAPGFKYNMADPLAAIGIHQVAKAEALRMRREQLADIYSDGLERVEGLRLPVRDDNRIQSWHLFAVRLELDRWSISRDRFLDELKNAGIGTSVHWRPLHLHPYYQNSFGWQESDCPVASEVWIQRVSLPLFPGMTGEDTEYVIDTIRALWRRYGK